MKNLIRKISQAALLMAAWPSLTQAITLSDIPLFLTAPVEPNIVMTLDDSGSMGSAYVPDALSGAAGTKRFASSDYNSLYYNPAVTYAIPTRKDGVTYTTSFGSARRNGFDSGKGTVNLGTSYKVTVEYYNDMSSATETGTASAAYYYRYLPTSTGCSPANKTNDACYQKVTVGTAGDVTPGTAAQQQQNFANWYSFYRTRALSTISGAMTAVGQIGDNEARFAWQSINCSPYTCCNRLTSASYCKGYTSTTYDNRIRNLNAGHRSDFYNWVQRFSSDGGTPLRTAMKRAGALYQTSGVNSPYAENPQVTDGTELACRKNFHIMVTDGIWNTDSDSTGNQDNGSKTLPDGVTYTAMSPYKDANSNSLADIAFYYWSTDLRTDLANKVPPYTADASGSASYQYWNAKNDPASWQHMVNFTMGIGLTGTMINPVWGGSTYAGDYPALVAGTKTWPATGSNVSPGNVYDLWHAAIDSRGQFFSVEDPAAMTTSFRTILNSINSNVAAAAGLATNASSILTDSLLFQARFVPSDWSGQLLAIPILSGGKLGTAAVWDAGTKMALRDPSKIFTLNTSGSGAAGIPFAWASLSSAQQTLLNKNLLGVADGKGSDRLNWLKGDAGKEVRNGGTFRDRTKTVLGDIVNSDVAYTRNESYGYDSAAFKAVASEGATYAAYLTYKSGKPSGTIFVGANDGMLHAFNADAASGGNELFAYIPNAVMGKLSALTDPGYAHQYYVDGSPGIADAYFGGGWKTALVSGLGKGGQAVFALDITDPGTFAAGNVLWEKTPGSTGYANLGYVYSKPKIVRLNSGQWAAVFGNGYNSTSGAASLFVVNLATGALISEIVVDNGSGGPNGLSEPVLADTNGDRIADTAYAGDLKGNMWKFDLTSLTSPYKLFTATSSSGTVQPITAAPTYGPSPDTSAGGLMVYFGTGQYLGSPDVSDTSVQSFYAVWDKGGAVSGRGDLQEQTILGETTTPDGYQVRETSDNSVNYTVSPTQLGWYMDFSYGTTGERVVRKPILALGWVLFTTVIPKDDRCDAGGDSWLYVMSPLDGKRPASLALDVNKDGSWDYAGDGYSSTVAPTAVKSKIGILSSPLVVGHSTSDTSWDAYTDMMGGSGTSATAGSATGSSYTSGSSGAVDATSVQAPPGPPTPPTPPGGGTVQRTYWIQIQ